MITVKVRAISKVNNGQHKSHWRLHDENRIPKSNPWSDCHGNECPCQRNGSRRRNLTVKSHHNHRPSWKIMLQGWKTSCGRIMGSSPLHCGYPKWLQSMIYQVPILLARDIFQCHYETWEPVWHPLLDLGLLRSICATQKKVSLKCLKIKSTCNVLANNSMSRANNISLTFKPSGQV